VSWKKFYGHGPTALFHNQENALLRMRQIELSLWARLVLKLQCFLEQFLLPGDYSSVP
jgi:hypothetical protein